MATQPQPNGEPLYIVGVHAWRYEDGDQTYSDADAGEPVDGWCAYLRVNEAREGAGEGAGDFDIPADTDRDFTGQTARADAMAFAERLALQHGAEIRTY